MENPVNDLRSAIALLKRHEGQYIETDHPVDPNAELAGVYRHIGAGGTVKRPTRTGPAMMFNSVKGYPGSRILVGMHASRERAALLLGCAPSELAKHVGQAVKNRSHPLSSRPRRPLVRSRSSTLTIRTSICANCCQHQPIRRLMQARSSAWDWCWQAIRRTAR